MHLKQILGLALCGGLLCVPARAQQEPAKEAKQPKPTLNRHGFFSKPTYTVEPRIEEVLLLSPEQKTKLQTIADELLLPLTEQETQRKLQQRRAGIQPTPEERQNAAIAFAITMGRAVQQVRTLSKVVLTPEQIATVEKIEASVKKATEAAATDTTQTAQGRFEKIKAEVSAQLELVLSPQQRAALNPQVAQTTAFSPERDSAITLDFSKMEVVDAATGLYWVRINTPIGPIRLNLQKGKPHSGKSE